MTALLPILMGFILTGVISNWLIHKWQHRNWVNQQKLLKANSSLAELKKIIDSITSLSDHRNFRTRKLGRNIGNVSTERLDELKREYDQAVSKWNDQWNSFCIGLTLYADHSFTQQLENRIQTRFVCSHTSVSQLLKTEDLTQIRSIKAQLEEELNAVSGETFRFSRDLLRIYLEKEREAYEPSPVLVSPETIESAPTWQLIKSLFKAPQI